jgi:Domain of unknown function (DUF4252)
MNGAVMKSVLTKSLKFISLLLLATAASYGTAQAQDIKLQLDNLDKLEPRAEESINVSMDGALLRIAIPFLRDSDPKEAAVKELVIGLKGVYVKSFEFDKEGEYTSADVDSIRVQLRAPNWTKMVGVRSKKEGENLEVYMTVAGAQVGGIVVIATDPKQLTVVNIVGKIDLEKLAKLSGQFGIPSIEIKIDGKEPKE